MASASRFVSCRSAVSVVLQVFPREFAFLGNSLRLSPVKPPALRPRLISDGVSGGHVCTRLGCAVCGSGVGHHLLRGVNSGVRNFHSCSVTPPAATLVTQKAPDFTAEAVMSDGSFKSLTLSSFTNSKYVILLFYPLDFTFVCPSEILAFHQKLDEFKKRNVEVIGVSVDSHFAHYAWRATSTKAGGIGEIGFPLVSDLSKDISRKYGVLLNNSISLRGLFLIDREGVVRHSLVNDLPLGRSVDETIRVVDALQFTEQHGEVCPANWNSGKEGMKPSTDGMKEYISRNY